MTAAVSFGATSVITVSDVTRNTVVSGASGVSCRSSKWAGNKKKFSWRQPGLGTAEISRETTNDCELSERGRFASFIKIPFSDFE